MLFSFFFLITDLQFLFPATIAQILNLIVEIIITLETSTKEAKAEMEIHRVTTKTKVRKCSMQFRFVQTLLLKNSFWSIYLIK